MNLVFLGMPGAGKGTIAKLIEKKTDYPHISTGDILRKEVENQSELGKQADAIMKSGELVPDELMVKMIKNRLDGLNGFILDGFPRTVAQAKSLDVISRLDCVVFFRVDADIVKARLLSRTDDSGEKRADDDIEIIEERLRVYAEKTKPLYDYYQQQQILKEVDASAEIPKVEALAQKALGI